MKNTIGRLLLAALFTVSLISVSDKVMAEYSDDLEDELGISDNPGDDDDMSPQSDQEEQKEYCQMVCPLGNEECDDEECMNSKIFSGKDSSLQQAPNQPQAKPNSDQVPQQVNRPMPFPQQQVNRPMQVPQQQLNRPMQVVPQQQVNRPMQIR